jgi:hypothetical protein
MLRLLMVVTLFLIFAALARCIRKIRLPQP